MTQRDEHAHRACLARLAEAQRLLAAARALLAAPLSVVAAEGYLDDWEERFDGLENGCRGAQRDVGGVLAQVIAAQVPPLARAA